MRRSDFDLRLERFQWLMFYIRARQRLDGLQPRRGENAPRATPAEPVGVAQQLGSRLRD